MASNSLRIVLSVCLLASLSLKPCRGHGAMIHPVPRHMCKENDWSGGNDSGHGGGNQGGEGGLPSFCGDPFAGMPNSDMFKKPCPPQAQYEEGSTITIVTDVTTNHGGHYQFAVCPDTELTQECFDKYTLRDAFHGGVSWFLPKYGTNAPKTQTRMVLPAGLTCDNCVLMWTWWTAEVCYHECDPTECNIYAEGINGVFHSSGNGPPNMPKCPAIPKKGDAPQIYRNCADIQIVPKGTPLTMPFKILQSRNGKETTSEMPPKEDPVGDWVNFPSATLTGTSTTPVKFSTVTTTAVGAPPTADKSGLPPSAPMPPPFPGSVSSAVLGTSGSGNSTLSVDLSRESTSAPTPASETAQTPSEPDDDESDLEDCSDEEDSTDSQPGDTMDTSADNTGSMNNFYSYRKLLSEPSSQSSRRLFTKQEAPEPFKKFPDGLHEIDARGKASVTPLNNGEFGCEDKKVRKVLKEINAGRLKNGAMPFLCSNKASGGAWTIAHSMCLQHEEIHDRATHCKFNKLGDDCKDFIVIGDEVSPLNDITDADEKTLLTAYGEAAGVGYKVCKDGNTYWAIFMG